MSVGPALSFVLLERAEYPDPEELQRAASELGLTVRPEALAAEGPVTYDIAGAGTLLIMLMEVPHPDAAQMARGLASPEPAELERMTAHYVVTALGLPGDPPVRDALMATLTAAVVRASPSIAAMLGHGVVFHKAAFFADVVASAEGELPTLVCVDVTMASEPDDRMSFLTHGMARYGREEFFVTASQHGKGALDFLLGLVRWLLADPDKHLPTGETVGRSAEERVLIQRVPSPMGEGPEVIRLDLDA
jgi:hypothetical protein